MLFNGFIQLSISRYRTLFIHVHTYSPQKDQEDYISSIANFSKKKEE